MFRHCLNCSIAIPSLSELSCVPSLSERSSFLSLSELSCVLPLSELLHSELSCVRHCLTRHVLRHCLNYYTELSCTICVRHCLTYHVLRHCLNYYTLNYHVSVTVWPIMCYATVWTITLWIIMYYMCPSLSDPSCVTPLSELLHSELSCTICVRHCLTRHVLRHCLNYYTLNYHVSVTVTLCLNYHYQYHTPWIIITLNSHSPNHF